MLWLELVELFIKVRGSLNSIELSSPELRIKKTGHLNEGTMHFFGGADFIVENTKMDFRKQHFSIESKFDWKMPKMIKHDDLEIGFNSPACSSFELTHKLIKTSVVDIRDL